LAALILGSALSTQAECDNCPQRQVTMYDFNVTAPRPDSLADIVVWYSLFFAGPGAAATIFTPQCARFIDGSFYRDSTGVPSKSLTVGIDHPNTAPAGNLKGMDYLLNGSVSPDGSGFKVDMSLECACNRKTVVTASKHFDRADQASTAAADLARQKFIPISDVIRQFERDTRNSDPDVSIGGFNSKLVVDPARRKANMGEKIPVTFTLTDCDGEPLAGRKLSLTGGGNKMAPPSTNGSYAVSEATTGSDGKVTVDFTVGATKGTAIARAYFFHKTPFGCEAVAVDEAAIDVEGSAPYYQVRYEYVEAQDMVTDYEEKYTPTWIESSRRTHSQWTVISGSAIFKNISNAPGGSSVELEGAGLEGGLLNGTYNEMIYFTANKNYSDAIATIRGANYESRISNGAPIRSNDYEPDFYVNLDPADLGESSQFSFGIPFGIKGTVSGQGYEVTTASGQTFDTTTSVNDTTSEETPLGPSVKMLNHYSLKDSVFHVDASIDTNWSAEGTKTNLKAKLTATVSPILVRPKSNGIFAARAQAAMQGRIRVLNNGSRISCRVQDVASGVRVLVERYSLGGKLLSVLYDAPRGTQREIGVDLDRVGADAGDALSVLVFRAGNARESRVLYRNP
jgi:hypothetical protein